MAMQSSKSSNCVWDYRDMRATMIMLLWHKLHERKKEKRWAHSGTGINPEARGKKKPTTTKKKKHPPPLAVGQPISTQRSRFTWRPKNLCVVIWHHQLPIKGEVTFSFLPLFPPPLRMRKCGAVFQERLRNKDPFKHLSVLFFPYIDCLHKRIVVVAHSHFTSQDCLNWMLE